MLLKKFDKAYSEVLGKLISEGRYMDDREYQKRQWEAAQDERRAAIRHEQDPEAYPDPEEEAWKEREEEERRKERDLPYDQLKAKVQAEIKGYSNKSTEELKKIMLDFPKTGDYRKDNILDDKQIAALNVLLKRSDVDFKFYEDFVFDISDNISARAMMKNIIVNDPKIGIKDKIINREYSVKDLKPLFDYMCKNHDYRLFDSNIRSS